MAPQPRRGVTRGYVRGLIAACLVVAVALLVAVWGFTSLLGSASPVQTESVPRWLAPVLVAIALVVLAAAMWQQALALLRGRVTPAWTTMFVGSLLAYLVWCLGGTLGRLQIEETWLSVYAWVLVPIWFVSCLAFWAVLVRRVYTELPPPRWPWERDERAE
ncbi:hypothetical protein ICL81_07280 [Leucobacter sp. cx-328]|nr:MULTISPECIES: hypothetical protein [unclassified Leucobacter]MBC9944310.1 hypothetical protein [Leucobacter sp. cx-328]